MGEGYAAAGAVVGEPRHPLPRGLILLTASSKRAPPKVRDVVAERPQGPAIGRHRMVGEEAANNLPQPLPLLGDRLVPSPPHLLLDLLELGSHAVSPGLPGSSPDGSC